MYKETKIGGGRYNAMMYTPAGAKWTLVFIPGKGEVGTAASDLQELDNHGPFNFINSKGWKPDFNVIAIQPPTTSITWQFVEQCLKDVVAAGHKNLVLTGLSGGAEHIYLYMRTLASKKYDIKATMPMSFYIWAYGGDRRQKTDHLGEFKNSSGVVTHSDWLMADTPSWGFCGVNDGGHYGLMKRYYDLLKAYNKNSKFTTYPTGHDSWNKYYNPEYRENGESIYEWAARMAVGTIEPDPIPLPEPTTPEPYKLDNGATLIFNQDGSVSWK